MDRISKILLERETIDAEQFAKLLEGGSEEEVFGGPEEEEPTAPKIPAEPEKKAGREGPRPVPRPRPGFAGSAEMRADPPDAV
jgi:hypothetical protein